MPVVRHAVLIAAAGAAAILAVTAHAAATPVGPLPTGPTTTVSAKRGTLVSVALPLRAGKSWRVARAYNPRVVAEVTEATVGKQVVLVYRAVGPGSTRVVFGLTRGETRKAYASATYAITVR
jgi:hypothetical protein